MTRRTLPTYLIAAAAVGAAGLVLPASAAAHCDSLDGPVVKSAQRALTTGNVGLTLAWVRPQDEPAIGEAFDRTLRVPAAGEVRPGAGAREPSSVGRGGGGARAASPAR